MKLLKTNIKNLRGKYFSTPIEGVFAQTDGDSVMVWSNALDSDAIDAEKEYSYALHALFTERQKIDGTASAVVEFGALAKCLRKLVTAAPNDGIEISANSHAANLEIRPNGSDEYDSVFAQLIRSPLHQLRCSVNAKHLEKALRALALPPKSRMRISVSADALGEGELYCPLLLTSDTYLDGALIVSIATTERANAAAQQGIRLNPRI